MILHMSVLYKTSAVCLINYKEMGKKFFSRPDTFLVPNKDFQTGAVILDGISFFSGPASCYLLAKYTASVTSFIAAQFHYL